MPKETIPFEAFADAAGEQNKAFVESVHGLMLDHGCGFKMKEAKSGYVVSYTDADTKRTIANYVFRKQGPRMRVYAENVASYEEVLSGWPDAMKTAVKKCGPCKRMLDPNDCSGTCRMGFDFTMDGERQRKCRFNCFLIPLDEEAKPHLLDMLRSELAARGDVKNLMIEGIPAILWGAPSDKLFIAVHGDRSNKADEVIAIFADQAAEKGCGTLSFDLPKHGERSGETRLCNPQNATEETLKG